MKKTYRKRAEIAEKTNMGYATLADELCMDQWNEKLAQVVGLGFAAPSYAPSANGSQQFGAPIQAPTINDINESVAAITSGDLCESLSAKTKNNFEKVLVGLQAAMQIAKSEKRTGRVNMVNTVYKKVLAYIGSDVRLNFRASSDVKDLTYEKALMKARSAVGLVMQSAKGESDVKSRHFASELDTAIYKLFQAA